MSEGSSPRRRRRAPKPGSHRGGGVRLRTPAVEAEILSRIAAGETLTSICAEERMPCTQAVYAWIAADPEFAIAVALAREIGYDAIADHTLAIADTDPGGDAVAVAWQKNRIWTRLQLLSRWSPGRYGDRITHAGDAAAPLTITVQRLTDAPTRPLIERDPDRVPQRDDDAPEM